MSDKGTLLPLNILRAEKGCTEVAPALLGISPRSFVSGSPSDDRLKIRYSRREEDNALVGKVWFGPNTEGLPGYIHNGSIAAVLNEAMGGAARIAGHTVFNVRLNVQFFQMAPLGLEMKVEAWVGHVGAHTVSVCSRLWDSDNELYAEGTGLFANIKK